MSEAESKQQQLLDLGYPINVVNKELRKEEIKNISSAVFPDLPQEEMKHMDTLNLCNDAAILKLLNNEGDTNETVILSERLTKINRKGKKQERYLIITQKAIYNLLPKKYKKSQRRLAIKDIGMITLSSISSQFAIHIPSSYDYHFISDNRQQIARVLDELYTKQNSESLKLRVVYSELEDLKEIIFTKTLAKYEAQSPVSSLTDEVETEIEDQDHDSTSSNMDSLNLANNADIQLLIASESEKIILSEKVTKINRKGRNQERYLMITTNAVYNLIPNKYAKSKRRVALENIGMITMSLSSPEFAIHVPSEYDYHLSSNMKYNIVQCLSQVYKEQTNDDLIIVESELNHLKELILTKTLAKYEEDSAKEAIQQTIDSLHQNQVQDHD